MGSLSSKNKQVANKAEKKTDVPEQIIEKPSNHNLIVHCSRDLIDQTKEPIYVYSRRGSQFYDESGSLAHDFFEIIENPGQKTVIRQVTENLTPQGEIKLDVPRISSDCDIILYCPDEKTHNT